MSELAIKIENISKAYRIGLKDQRHDTLGGAIAALVKSPLKNFRKLRSLSEFRDHRDSDIFWALNDINFEVKKGEVLGIIGKNGAGKSTLLKILSRITEPTNGRIEIYGRVAALLEVGTGFNPELSGRENVYLNGTILGMSRKEINGKFDEIIDFSGIEKFLDTPVKRYSSGMKVRLAFAVAAHLDPEILVIDEVLAVGDAEFQKKCLGKMHDVAQGEGRTVLFVSHNLDAVQGLCKRTILLENGRTKADARTKDVINIYTRDISDSIKYHALQDLKGRRGNKQIQLERFEIVNSNSEVIKMIRCGEDVIFRFYVNVPIEDDVGIVDIGLSIHDSDFNLLTLIYASYTKSEFYNIRNGSCIEFKLKDFPFTEGEYYCNYRITNKGYACDEFADPVFHFDVIRGDYYDSGIHYDKNTRHRFPVLIKGEWSVI